MDSIDKKYLKEIEDILDDCNGGGDIIIYESVERISEAILTWHNSKVLEARIDEIKMRVIAGHDVKACESMAKSDDERIDELQQLKEKE